MFPLSASSLVPSFQLSDFPLCVSTKESWICLVILCLGSFFYPPPPVFVSRFSCEVTVRHFVHYPASQTLAYVSKGCQWSCPSKSPPPPLQSHFPVTPVDPHIKLHRWLLLLFSLQVKALVFDCWVCMIFISLSFFSVLLLIFYLYFTFQNNQLCFIYIDYFNKWFKQYYWLGSHSEIRLLANGLCLV